MTARQLYQAVLTELHKVNAPSMTLEEFNYYANKTIVSTVEAMYAVYEVNQSSTDALSELASTMRFEGEAIKRVDGLGFEVDFPLCYLHLLNCICVFRGPGYGGRCDGKADKTFSVPATKMTADVKGQALVDYYNRPSIKKPYFEICNLDEVEEKHDDDDPTIVTSVRSVEADIQRNDLDGDNRSFFDGSQRTELRRTVSLSKLQNASRSVSLVDKPATLNVAGADNVRCQIIIGKDWDKYSLDGLHIQYLKMPERVHLSQDNVDMLTDYSQVIQFKDTVIYRVIGSIVTQFLERTQSGRLSSQMQIDKPTTQA